MGNAERYGADIMCMYAQFRRLAFPDEYRIAVRKWRVLHPEENRASSKRSRDRNPERGRRHSAKWARENKDKVNAANRKRYAENPNYRMTVVLRNALNEITHRQGCRKSARTMELLGCSIKDFRIYIESLFDVGMSWENYGKGGWELDHIVPCALFDMTDPEHQKRCFHFSNLQPMWETDNRRKGRTLKDFLRN